MSQRAGVSGRRTGLLVLDGVVVALFLAGAALAGPLLWDSFGPDPADLVFLLSPTFSMVGLCTGGLGALWWRCGRPGRGVAGGVVAFVAGFGYGCVAAMYLVGMVLGYLMRDWQF